MSLDHRHLETITRILEAIAQVEGETACAMIACEDAFIALGIGLSLDLTPHQIAEQVDSLMAQMCDTPTPSRN